MACSGRIACFKEALLLISVGCYYGMGTCFCSSLNLTELMIECPCMRATGDATRTVKAPNADSCYVLCMTTPGCTVFSYCGITKVCQTYNSDTSGYDFVALGSSACKDAPSESATSKRKWFEVTVSQKAVTETCKDIKANNVSGTDGYHKIKVRGVETSAWCVMSEPGDGLTYIDVEAWTYNSDTQASNLAKMSFERVKLVADDCTMSISGDDYRFSTQKPLGVTTYPEEARINGLLRGFGCGHLVAGRHLDLKGTPFAIPSWLLDTYTNGPSVLVTRTKQRFSSKGFDYGGCGEGIMYVIENGQQINLDSQYPIELYRP
ncbi:uncharacterized protein LOC142345317 [Convolutriloba macropyga]|uniref:uncharacterized protein LOC142345317 n=1 Tax=Convolutriloba macropyga TaxID=536237 RepID=UPI003F51ECC3